MPRHLSSVIRKNSSIYSYNSKGSLRARAKFWLGREEATRRRSRAEASALASRGFASHAFGACLLAPSALTSRSFTRTNIIPPATQATLRDEIV